jgi:hypothetical protein
MKCKKDYVIAVLLAVVLGLGLTACRSLSSEPTQKRLEERVKGYIQARIERNQDALKGYYQDPALARVGNIIYVKSDIADIKILPDGKNAEVVLKNSFKVMGFSFNRVTQKTRWHWEKGDWFMVVPKQSTPFGNSGKKGDGVGGKKMGE